MSILEFDRLRAEFSTLPPDDLYDIACSRAGYHHGWNVATWFEQSMWLDRFANAPTSYVFH